jgi:hypothetical protein
MPEGEVEVAQVRAEEFAEVARRYVAFIDARADQTAETLLLGALPLLCELTFRASVLPDLDADNPWQDEVRISLVDWNRLYRAIGEQLGEFNLYWDSDPFEADEPGTAHQASLADDLADVYRDVSDGLPPDGTAASPGTVWRWRFTFHSHWGEHALRAARAVQMRIFNDELGEDEDDDVAGA